MKLIRRVLLNALLMSSFSFRIYAFEDEDGRAPRLDAPPVTSPISIVVPALDLGAILQTLGSIKCKIGNVDQPVCDDTILSVLGDACGILGISISEALKILIDCCDQTPTVEVTCTVDLSGVFTVLDHLVVTATVDLSEIFTVLQDIKDTETTCCATLIQDFNSTWTILAGLNTLVVNDFNSTWTILNDIKNTDTACCATLIQDFNNTWTILAAIESTLAINCGVPTPITQAMIPFTITDPGSYCLAEDVTVPGGATGITITSANVILDLNDHQIIAGDIGIALSGGFPITAGIIIKNGIIRDQAVDGINGFFAEYLIDGVMFLNSPTGIEVLACEGTLNNCTCFNNTLIGLASSSGFDIIINSTFLFDAVSIQLQNTINTVIENSVFQASLGISVDFQSGALYLVMKNNKIESSGDIGIQIAGQQVTIENCDVIHPTNTGINIVAGAVSVVIANCNVIGSVNSDGIQINADDVHVINCSSMSNTLNGIELTASSSNAEVINNITTKNAGAGILNAGTANRIYRNYATNNGTNYVGVTPVNSPGGALSGNFNDFIANVSN